MSRRHPTRKTRAGLASARANHPTATAAFTSDGWEGWIVAHERAHTDDPGCPSLDLQLW